MAHYDCFQAAASILCEKHGRNPEWLFAGNFGMEYFAEEECFFNRMNPRTCIEADIYLQLACGFEKRTIPDQQGDLLAQLREFLRKKYDVIVLVDAFDCPWNQAYQKKHLFHYFFVFQYLEENGMFLCQDPYVSSQQYEISELLLQKGILEIFCFRAKEGWTPLELSDLSELMLRGYSKETIRQRYGRLREDLLKIEDFEQLYDDNDPNLCRILIVMKQLGEHCRGLACLFLTLCREKDVPCKCGQKRTTDCLYEISMLADASAAEWEKVTTVLLKMLLRGTVKGNSLYAIGEHLERICNCELEVYEKIDSLKWGEDYGQA